MFCKHCGNQLGEKFCSHCGMWRPGAKLGFMDRLKAALIMQSRAGVQQTIPYNGVNNNPDGSWSYRNDNSGNSVISDGQNIFFTK